MSVWTHVAGVIRVDALPALGLKPDFKKIFIKKLWDEEDEGECNMPYGSEGSLDYRIIENKDKTSLAAYTVVIFGDLRDRGTEDLDNIKNWWEKTLKEFNMVRQAVLQILPEDSPEPIVLQSGAVYE